MQTSRRRPVLIGIVSVAVVIAAVVGYSLVVLVSAEHSAADLAAGRPYCIQVSTRGGYRPVSRSLQLAGFLMRSRDGVMNHAVLAVRAADSADSLQLYHWSYFANAFEAGAHGDPPIYCQPRAQFVDHPERDEKRLEGRRFAYRGYEFDIARGYLPRPLIRSRGTLMISARSPDFSPGEGYACPAAEAPCTAVEVIWGTDPNIESWRARPGAQHRIEDRGEYHGLLAARISSGTGSPAQLQYHVDDDTHRTLIVCADDGANQCAHLFSEGAFSYHFNHKPMDVENWQEMQARLRARVSAFIVSK